MRLVGIYHLLCDHCNLLFTGFVVPGTLRSRQQQDNYHKKTKKNTEVPGSPSTDVN
jgi:hypothetical protein